MDLMRLLILCITWFLIGGICITLYIVKKEPVCPDNLPVRVYDLQTKTLTCFPPPLSYGQGRKELKKEI